jgi:hypothetical protein
MAEYLVGFANGVTMSWLYWMYMRGRRRKDEAYRIGVIRSLGREAAERPDSIGTAQVRPASYRRTRWEGDER